MGDFLSILDPLNLTGRAGGAGGVQSVVGGFTGKPSAQSQDDALAASSEATRALMEMSRSYYQQTAGLRGNVVDRLSNFMEGNFDPTASAMYAPIKMTAERQYDTARNKVMEETPLGGALFENLANLSGQKAESITDQIARIVQDEYNKAYAMGQGSQTVSAAGVQGAAQNTNQQLSALAQQQSAGAQGTGNAVSLIAALLKFIA